MFQKFFSKFQLGRKKTPLFTVNLQFFFSTKPSHLRIKFGLINQNLFRYFNQLTSSIDWLMHLCKDLHSVAFQLTFIQTFRKYLGAFDKVKGVYPQPPNQQHLPKCSSTNIISNFNFSVKISICTQQCHILYSMFCAK